MLLSEHLVLLFTAAYFLAAIPFVPSMASPYNLENILFSAALPLLLVATGETIVIITGGIDLSVGSIIAMTSIAGAAVMSEDGGLLEGSAAAAPAAVLCMLALGTALGTINGVAVSRLGMPPFIVTLASMMFWSGLAIWLVESKKISGLPPGFTRLESGAVLGIPVPLIIAFAVISAAHVVLSRSVLGRWLYAIGHNVRAATVCGIPVHRATIAAYAASGACAAAASILYTAQLETGDPTMGSKVLLDVIGAVVIGGTSLFGGRGSVLWTISGVLFIAVISNSLDMFGRSAGAVTASKGGLILLAAFVDALRNRFFRRGAFPGTAGR